MIDLSPWLDAVPAAVIERLSTARRVLAVGHENPDADTLGATLENLTLAEGAGAINGTKTRLKYGGPTESFPMPSASTING